MTDLLIAAGFVALLALLSIGADRRFRAEDRLPMQWSLTGKVNWTAPRRLALAFTPTLAVLMLGGTALAMELLGPPPPGEAHTGSKLLLLMGASLLAGHLLHLWLLWRTAGRRS